MGRRLKLPRTNRCLRVRCLEEGAVVRCRACLRQRRQKSFSLSPKLFPLRNRKRARLRGSGHQELDFTSALLWTLYRVRVTVFTFYKREKKDNLLKNFISRNGIVDLIVFVRKGLLHDFSFFFH